MVVCQDDGFIGGPMITEVGIPSTQCPDRAVNGVTVSLLIYTYSLPPILLVVQFHGGTLGRFYEVQWGTRREAPEVAILIFGKERDVPKFEFLGLL
jgi:hypothetical protein